MKPDTSKGNIALVAFSSLGDGLIYTMVAENLRLNGFAVNFFCSIAYQLHEWLPQLRILPYPPLEEMDSALCGFDLVIMSPPQFLRNHMDSQTIETMRRKWLLVCQKTPATWRFDLTESKRKELPSDTFEALKKLMNCGGAIRDRKYSTESVVDITLEYMQKRMGLAQLTREVKITPPPNLIFQRHQRRIIISPDSASPQKKNWSEKGFLKLCQTLKTSGHEPKIVVAPNNHAHWQKMPGNTFDTPLFTDISDLAAYIYESRAVITNDSGNGHLASFLGIPVVTIYRHRNPTFHWRPDWGPGIVVCPKITFSLLGNHIWKPFISTSQIISALNKIT